MSRESVILGANGRPFVVNSAYDAATRGPRSKNWNAPAGGPNSTLASAHDALVRRSRAAYRNNALIAGGIESNVTNEIGTGIIPRSRCSNEEIRAQINELWNLSVNEFDPEGNLDFYGMQVQACRARRVGSECFIRKRSRRADYGLAVPLQLQILESEFVPVEKTELNRNQTIKQGVQFNIRQQRTFYWMHSDFPESYGVTNRFQRLLRIPAGDVIHHFLPTRPGQVRGEPDAVQALLKAVTFDEYDDAELIRKKTRAHITGFIERDPYADEEIDPDEELDGGNIVSGALMSMIPGEKVKLVEGDNTGNGYSDFMRWQSLLIARGMNMPYELLTGDWGDVNDRLVRAILNEYRRQIEMAQDHLMIYQVCRKVWEWWLDAAVMSGALTIPDYYRNRADYQKAEWRPHGWAYVHPEQDINAAIKAMDANLDSLPAQNAKRGWDFEDVVRQNVEAEKFENEIRKEAGLGPKIPKPTEKKPMKQEPSDDELVQP